METMIQKKRIQTGLTLREVAKALGPGFSPARLSLAERGLIRISSHEEGLILEAIDRLGPLCADRRRIVETARKIDFAPFLADLRESRVIPAQV